MRFGLVGTGPWAELAHGPGLVAAEGVELVGIWGRIARSGPAPRQTLGVAAYDDYAALLADVEAVAFAVPPAVQAEMALEAAARREVTSSSTSRWRPIPARPGPCSPPPPRPASRRWSSSPTGSSTRPGLDRRRPRHRGLARRVGAVVQRAPGAGQPVRRLAVAARGRCAVGHRAARALHAHRHPGPHRVAHRGARPGRRGLPHRTPRVRADQHHRAVAVRATRRQPVRGHAVGRGRVLDDAAPPGRRLRGPPRRRPRRSWWRAPPAGCRTSSTCASGCASSSCSRRRRTQLDRTATRDGTPA